jgi:hypothetical protein
MEELIEREVGASHQFFADWLSGRLPRREALMARHFVGRLDPGFTLIDPTGRMIPAEQLGRELWAGHGTGARFEIFADQFRCRHADGAVVVATYREWQRNAVRSTPPDNGRAVTAVFRIDDTAANTLRWVLVHETWLPAEVVAERLGRPAIQKA